MPFGRIGRQAGGQQNRIVVPFRSETIVQPIQSLKQLEQKTAVEAVAEQVPGLRILAPIAKPGIVLPKAYGTNRIVGYIFWLGNYDEEEHTIDFAMVIQEGYLKGIRSIWADNKGKKIYSARTADALEGSISANNYWKNFRIYHGTGDQDPDPLMTAKDGNSPGYRDSGYVMFVDWDLAKRNYEVWPLSFETVGTTIYTEPEVDPEYSEEYAEETTCIPCTDTSSYIYAAIEFEGELWLGKANGSVQSYNPATGACTNRGTVYAGEIVHQFCISDISGSDKLYAACWEGVYYWNGSGWTSMMLGTGDDIEVVAARPGGYLYTIRYNKCWYHNGSSWTEHGTTLTKFAASPGSGFYNSGSDEVYFCSSGGAGGVYVYSISAANVLSSSSIGGSGNGYVFVTDSDNIYLVRSGPDAKVQYRVGFGSWITYSSSVGNFPEGMFLFRNRLHVASREALGIELYRDNGSGTFSLINDNIAVTGGKPGLIKDSNGNPYCHTDCLYEISDETA